MPLRRIRAVFRRKSDERLALENLLELVEENSPVVPRIKYKKPSKKISKRSLEISICDPHLGLNCYPPECQDAYSLEDCEQLFMWAIDSLVDQSSRYENITEIVYGTKSSASTCIQIPIHVYTFVTEQLCTTWSTLYYNQMYTKLHR